MQTEHDTSPTASPSFELGMQLGRIRSQLDLIMQCLLVLLQRSIPSTTSAKPPATITSTPTAESGLLRRMAEKLSMEALSSLLEATGKFLLRKVLPAGLASALAAASGLGSALTKWLGLLWKLLLGG